MVVVISSAEVLVSNVCIDLRGGNVAVAKQRLHGTRIGAMLQQVSRETMAQRVRRNVTDSDAFCVTLDRGPRELAS